MVTKAQLKTVAVTLVVIWALNQNDTTKNMLNGSRSFFG